MERGRTTFFISLFLAAVLVGILFALFSDLMPTSESESDMYGDLRTTWDFCTFCICFRDLMLFEGGSWIVGCFASSSEELEICLL